MKLNTIISFVPTFTCFIDLTSFIFFPSCVGFWIPEVSLVSRFEFEVQPKEAILPVLFIAFATGSKIRAGFGGIA